MLVSTQKNMLSLCFFLWKLTLVVTSAKMVDWGDYGLPQEPSPWPSLIGLGGETSSGGDQSIVQFVADQSYKGRNEQTWRES